MALATIAVQRPRISQLTVGCTNPSASQLILPHQLDNLFVGLVAILLLPHIGQALGAVAAAMFVRFLLQCPQYCCIIGLL